MELIPTDYQIQNRLAARATADGANPGQLDRDAFLNLLITQLENQDPMSPLQDHEFVAQLATFSSLEQLESMSASLQASLLVDQSVNNALSTNLIGKEILADGSRIRLGTEGEPSFVVNLPAGADVTVMVRDAQGNLVKRIPAGSLASGQNTVNWDGTNESGSRAAAGDYRIDVIATNPDGNPVSAKVQVRALVTGVRFESGTGYLVAGGQQIPLSSVLEVFAAS
jgi:flagellar basal-body rod modification protein FlgD